MAHHEPLLAEPRPDRHIGLLDVVGCVHPQLHAWLDSHNRVRAELDAGP
ncbi:hypothetical protein [Blastococcus saxobsidens]|nr:hypothetical protein [Blastococcus saxobsidens]